MFEVSALTVDGQKILKQGNKPISNLLKSIFDRLIQKTIGALSHSIDIIGLHGN